MSQPEIVMYSSRYCPFCVRAKALFFKKKLVVNEILVDQQPEVRRKMMVESGRHTVPQIWIGGQHIGGCDELLALEQANKLESLLTV
jgi:glutaredoxin 3